jgi:dCMP deaminase
MKRQDELYFVAYIPVIHRGYINALQKYPGIKIGILDNPSVLELAPYIRKDIRKLDTLSAQKALAGMGYETIVINIDKLRELAQNNKIITPDDDISRTIEEAYPDISFSKVPIFLRWDRDNTHESSELQPKRTVTLNAHEPVMQLLSAERHKSSNWWRRVAAAVIKDGEIVSFAYNHPLPNEHTSWEEGDPRIVARRGESIELSIDIHAEASIIADCAKTGKALKGTSIYVTTFPCPNCAKLIALSGVEACYYVEGYATLDGERILQDFGVETIKINSALSPEDPDSLVSYPTS